MGRQLGWLLSRSLNGLLIRLLNGLPSWILSRRLGLLVGFLIRFLIRFLTCLLVLLLPAVAGVLRPTVGITFINRAIFGRIHIAGLRLGHGALAILAIPCRGARALIGPDCAGAAIGAASVTARNRLASLIPGIC